MMININTNCDNPDLAWKKMRFTCRKSRVSPQSLHTPISSKHIRFVCISDTHCRRLNEDYFIPPGDVLLHAGDFTGAGRPEEVKRFNDFLGTLPHPHKIVIAGNHEICFEEKNLAKYGDNVKNPRTILTNCTYIEDSHVFVYGYKIYGSPWTPEFCSWAFNKVRGEDLLERWMLIPEDTDILMTHGPPVGYGDKVVHGYRVGCTELLSVVRQRVKPKYHVFGHIHEDHGLWTDGTTTFINASVCDKNYKPIQSPYIFDLPLPKGVEKLPLLSTTESTTACTAGYTQPAFL